MPYMCVLLGKPERRARMGWLAWVREERWRKGALQKINKIQDKQKPPTKLYFIIYRHYQLFQ